MLGQVERPALPQREVEIGGNLGAEMGSGSGGSQSLHFFLFSLQMEGSNLGYLGTG